MAARRARLWTMIAVVVFLSMVALLVGTGSMVGFVERIRE
jgi:cytochrome c-type biogenesis protein CcmE